MLRVWNNSPKMNLPEIVFINIQSNAYFKGLLCLKTYHEVLQEIKNEVTNLEPSINGSPQSPSTAWCLLFKLFTLKLTENQLSDMLDRETNPFIRGMAMLYLRFVCVPEQMWDWFGPYLIDEHEIPVKRGQKPIFLGILVRQLITDPKFCEVTLPRIPVLIHREMVAKIEQEYGPDLNTKSRDRNNNRQKRNRSSGDRSPSPERKRPRSRSPRQHGSWERDRTRDQDLGDRNRNRDQDRDRTREQDRDRQRNRDHDRGSYRYRRSRSPDSRRRRSRSPYRNSRGNYNSSRSSRDSGERRYDSHRSSSKESRHRNSSSSPGRTPSRSPSPSPVKETRPAAPNPSLEKLKAIYGSIEQKSSSNTVSTYSADDSIDTDVVRIGF